MNFLVVIFKLKLAIKKKLSLLHALISARFWPGSFFYQLLNLITMEYQLSIKSFVFGLAFWGRLGFGGITSQAQDGAWNGRRRRHFVY